MTVNWISLSKSNITTQATRKMKIEIPKLPNKMPWVDKFFWSSSICYVIRLIKWKVQLILSWKHLWRYMNTEKLRATSLHPCTSGVKLRIRHYLKQYEPNRKTASFRAYSQLHNTVSFSRSVENRENPTGEKQITLISRIYRAKKGI